MKLYCELCKKTQPVRIDNCRDSKTNEPYQDIVCAECDFVIASGTDITQPEQEPVAWLCESNDYGVWKSSVVLNKIDSPAFRNFVPLYTASPSLEAAVSAEREACAKFVDHILREGGGTYGDAIRARGEK